jgi:site-specific recombinase XerD
MQNMTTGYLIHCGRECITVHFDHIIRLNNILAKLPDARWSRTHKCWLLPCTPAHYKQLANSLKGIATIDATQLNEALLKRRRTAQTANIVPPPAAKTPGTPTHDTLILPDTPSSMYAVAHIHPVNAHILPILRQQLVLKAYSPSTIRTYMNETSQLLQTLKGQPADELTTQRIKDYLQYCHEKLKLSENTLHSRMNALKFYYEQVLKKEKFFWEIPRPKKQFQLPSFFNQDEIAQIIKQTANLKHKTMLMLSYAAGLRVSEVTNLKVSDIDSKRMQIKISQSKGKKDRMVSLSPILLVMLREYFVKYKPQKNGYLFYGQLITEPYSSRSLQLVIQEAKERAGILKPGSIHALRHSFATHLLDNGTDVTMIMKLLGHNDLKTTLRYLHLTNRDILKIVSPLDNLNLS